MKVGLLLLERVPVGWVAAHAYAQHIGLFADCQIALIYGIGLARLGIFARELVFLSATFQHTIEVVYPVL